MTVLPTPTTAAPTNGVDSTAKQTGLTANGDFRNVLQRAATPSGTSDVEREQSARELEATMLAAVSWSPPTLPTPPATPRSTAVKEDAGTGKSNAPIAQNPPTPKQQNLKEPEADRTRDGIQGTQKEIQAAAQRAGVKAAVGADSKEPVTETTRNAHSANTSARADAKDIAAAAQISPRQGEVLTVAKKLANQPKASAKLPSRATSGKTARVPTATLNANDETSKKRDGTDKAAKVGGQAGQPDETANEKAVPVKPILATADADTKKEQSQTSLSHNKADSSGERGVEKAANGKSAETNKPDAVANQQTAATQLAEAKLAATATALVRITAEKIRELQAMVARAVQGLRASADGTNETVFRWHEPQLGMLSFRISTSGDDVHLDIRADRRDVVTALEQNHTAIEQALASSGLRLQTFDVHQAAFHSEVTAPPDNYEHHGEQQPESAAENSAQTAADDHGNFSEKTSEIRKPVWVEHEWVA